MATVAAPHDAAQRCTSTISSVRPPMDATEARWRRRPVLAFTLRAVITLTPLLASVVAGVAASRIIRPVGWEAIAAWALWVAGVSFAVLAVTDLVVRRLLPLQRLLQLCLVFPDRAPSRLRLAAAAARTRRPEALAESPSASATAADTASRIVAALGALAMHDRRTRGHSERVCALTDLLAEQMQLPQHDRDRLMWVALIHDIGKLHVAARLLNKPSQPTLAEWRALQAHPEHGDTLVAPMRAWLGEWADAVLQHHERCDGTGYPHGLTGDEISLGARIIAVTDAFEVMTAPRPYRRPVDAQSARAELARHAGTQFDPVIVRHFLAVGLPKLRTTMGWLSWLGQVPFLRDWPKLQSAPAVTGAQVATATVVASSASMLVFGATAPPAVAEHLASPRSGGTSAATTTTSTLTPTEARPVAEVKSSPPIHRRAAMARTVQARDVDDVSSDNAVAAVAPRSMTAPHSQQGEPTASPSPSSCPGADAPGQNKSPHDQGHGHAYGRLRHDASCDSSS